MEAMNISGSTQVYGIVGHPVTHSLSPLFQSFFIQQAQINGCYVPFPVTPDDFTTALHGLRAAGVRGLNITIPHKATAFSLANCDPESMQIGAINTLKNNGQTWLGCNTDHIGVERTLQGLQADVSSALVFGAGGTTRAVIHALANMGAKQLYLCNRTSSRAEALQQHAAQHYPQLRCSVIPWQDEAVRNTVAHTTLCINSSSIGLHDGDVFPFELKGAGVAMDAVYRPDGQTAFLRRASITRSVYSDGLPMLIAQGAASFAWWHDCAPPDGNACLTWLAAQLPRTAQPLPGWM
jgi:shikimate dehydrogenase